MDCLYNLIRWEEIAPALGITHVLFILVNILGIIGAILWWLPVGRDAKVTQLVSMFVVHHEVKRLDTPTEIDSREQLVTYGREDGTCDVLVFPAELYTRIEAIVHNGHDFPFKVTHGKPDHGMCTDGLNRSEDEIKEAADAVVAIDYMG
eukprot:4617468-Prymnesium_polylepis.1